MGQRMHVPGHGQFPRKGRRGPTLGIDGEQEIVRLLHLARFADQRKAVGGEVRPASLPATRKRGHSNRARRIRINHLNPTNTQKNHRGNQATRRQRGVPERLRHRRAPGRWRHCPERSAPHPCFFASIGSATSDRRALSIFHDSISQKRCKRPPERGGLVPTCSFPRDACEKCAATQTPPLASRGWQKQH